MNNSFSRFYLLLSAMLILPFSASNSVAQSADYAKLSVWLSQIAHEQEIKSRTVSHENSRKEVENNNVLSVSSLLKISDDNPQFLNTYGVKVIDKIGEVIIADIPLNSIAPLSADKRIVRIESRQSNRLTMDTTMHVIGSKYAYEGLHLPQAFTGKGVVVGIQDVGFDLTHPTFYSRDLKDYRVKAFWDQLSTDTVGSALYVGSDYTSKSDILNYAHSRDGLMISHGTHTAASAAGSGYNTDYRGIAFDSDLCIVSNAVTDDLVLIDSAIVYKYTYATDLLGFKYICDYADRVGKPCVISFSEGSHEDLRGDDMLYYEALNELVKTGHIIVASAGNSGHHYAVVKKPVGKERAGSYILDGGKSVMAMVEAKDDCLIRIVSHHSETERDTFVFATRDVFLAADSILRDSLSNERGCYSATVRGYRSAIDNATMVFEVTYTAPEPLNNSLATWIETEGEETETRMTIVKGEFYNKVMPSPLGEAEKGYTIHSPSSAPAVISVGATVNRKGYTTVFGDYRETTDKANGERAFYSSLGPTLDERTKPDVMAPGTNIISAYSSYYLEANPDASDITNDISHFGFNGRTYAWNANSGTSMSSPIVAGVIALWLEAKPTLSRDEIIDVFRATCRQPDASLQYPNNYYGYGVIDAYAGLLYILGLDTSLGIDELSRQQPSEARFAIADRLLTIASDQEITDGTVSIYSVSGQLLLRQTIRGNNPTVDISSLKPAVYAVQLTTNNRLTTGSTLIRIE